MNRRKNLLTAYKEELYCVIFPREVELRRGSEGVDVLRKGSRMRVLSGVKPELIFNKREKVVCVGAHGLLSG